MNFTQKYYFFFRKAQKAADVSKLIVPFCSLICESSERSKEKKLVGERNVCFELEN